MGHVILRVRAPRSDGRRNREALLTSARIVFARLGPRAPLNAVAEHAGVGRGSLYRHFPTRTDLIFALFEESTERVEAAALELGGDPAAFGKLLGILIQGALDDLPLLGLIDHVDPHQGLDHLAERIHRAFETSLVSAQRAGLVDSDLRTSDVVLILRLLEGSLQGVPGPERLAALERTLWLLGSGTHLPRITLS